MAKWHESTAFPRPPAPHAEVVRRLGGGAGELARWRREVVDRPTLYLGAGTCGLGAGAGETRRAIRDELARLSWEADLVEVGCLGLCAEEPLLDVQLPGRARVSFGRVTAARLCEVLAAMRTGEPEQAGPLGQVGPGLRWPAIPDLGEHPFFRPQVRRVLANCGLMDPTSLAEYVGRGGYGALAETLLSGTSPEALCGEVEASGLRGRGGGGFSTGTKWRFARATEAETRYLVCNADEGDPGAFMDRAVIEGDPHRLIEGMALAGYAIGATQGIVYLRAEYPLAIARLEVALGQAREVGLLGGAVLGSRFAFDIRIKKGAGAFVCGEETALLESIEGKRGMPRPRPPYPAVSGLYGCPTVINNVETLANLPGLVRQGGAAFAALGTPGSKGTKVFALSGHVLRTGLVEVPMGTTVRAIVEEIGGGAGSGRPLKAAQLGGPSGGCIPVKHFDAAVDYESLKALGAMMGSGGLVVMDSSSCMVDVARFFMDFIQRESCGKCIPCREGTRRMLEILTDITRGRRSESGTAALHRFQGVLQLEELAEVIRATSLCGLGQSAPNPVLSTLRYFRDEYEAHVFDRRCPAGVCPELLHYTIDEARCKGCTLCVKACPAGAILGSRKSPHHIVDERCIRCGSCLDVCKFKAVNVA